ncbi:hypothetical protein AWM70_11980 [Paenibacillus yonginensis]|uniref:Transcription regulator PadR N-terminal domain-containing protein n=1 Tax=Paenibacillus yonginensis TaxID=1462996 RepID=A0A1B1N1E6_9BACL|nr:PadR family transcriptional regulator [Paenibacillus yonginensis]ANS75229.1 hypothetical protein AWM70_11980 [Paenibacillus yonginensis]
MSIQIAILGMLWDEVSHPYEIKKKIQRFDLDSVISISDGTLYYNFESLLKKGYIEEVEVVHSENRPDKTMYAITDKGRQGLKDEIYKNFKKNISVSSLYSSIPYLRLVEKERVVMLIEDIRQKIDQRIEFIERNKQNFPEMLKKPELQLLADYSQNGLENEKIYFERLLEIVKQM